MMQISRDFFQYIQEDGTLVLLDFGQVKALSLEGHAALARLIIALDRARLVTTSSHRNHTIQTRSSDSHHQSA